MQPGSLAVHLSGGYLMTVGYHRDGKIMCHWFDDDYVHHWALFHPSEIVEVLADRAFTRPVRGRVMLCPTRSRTVIQKTS